ncbi:hypothetical protein D3C73_1303660 [compost metagenome]
MAGCRIPASVEVVGHNVDPVDHRCDAAEVIVLDIGWASTGGDGQEIGFSVGGSGRCELLTDFLQEQHIILFVFRPVAVARKPPANRVFPVEVYTIHLVFADEVHC